MRIASNLIPLVVAVSCNAAAQATRPLTVERGAGAEHCPDVEALTTRIEQIRGRPSDGLATSYRVAFTRKDDGFTAVISSGARDANVRKLDGAGSTCAGLANATAVTLALLFDSDVEARGEAELARPAPLPIVATPVVRRAPAATEPSRFTTIAVGAGAVAGVLRPISPALVAEGGIAGPAWRLSIGALWAVPQTLALGPGTVRDYLLSGVARACVSPWQARAMRLDACSGAVVGAAVAQALGYLRNDHRTRLSVAVPIEVSLAFWKAPIAWELVAAGLVPVRRNDFSVDGVGVAYESPPIAGMVSLRAIGLFGW